MKFKRVLFLLLSFFYVNGCAIAVNNTIVDPTLVATFCANPTSQTAKSACVGVETEKVVSTPKSDEKPTPSTRNEGQGGKQAAGQEKVDPVFDSDVKISKQPAEPGLVRYLINCLNGEEKEWISTREPSVTERDGACGGARDKQGNLVYPETHDNSNSTTRTEKRGPRVSVNVNVNVPCNGLGCGPGNFYPDQRQPGPPCGMSCGPPRMPCIPPPNNGRRVTGCVYAGW